MLSQINKYYILSAILLIIICACKKDALPDKHYFGTLGIRLFPLPGTRDVLSVRSAGQEMGAVQKNGYLEINVVAEVPLKLGFYVPGTDTLVLDTTIVVPKNNTKNISLAISEALGIKGALDLPTQKPAPDSTFIILLNNLDNKYFSDPTDMEMFLVDGNTLEETPTGIFYRDIYKGKIYPGFMYISQQKGADGMPNNQFWVQKYIDKRNGKYVFQPNNGTEWAEFGDVPGHSVLLILNSDPYGNVIWDTIVLD